MPNSKKEKLEKLFDEWQVHQMKESDEDFENTKGNTIYITKKHFCKDGIICEEKYEKEKIKILFITNEANDDSYDAKNNIITSRIKSFNDYYNDENVEKFWRGKMRTYICSLYKAIIEDYQIPTNKVAQNFAFMNLNKPGGGNNIKDDNYKRGKRNHIEEYVKIYKKEIKNEIEIIDPDIIIWLSFETYDMNLHIKYLGAYEEEGKVFLDVKNKNVPILKLCHTSRARFLSNNIHPDSNFHNRSIGKMVTMMREELNRYNLGN